MITPYTPYTIEESHVISDYHPGTNMFCVQPKFMPKCEDIILYLLKAPIDSALRPCVGGTLTIAYSPSYVAKTGILFDSYQGKLFFYPTWANCEIRLRYKTDRPSNIASNTLLGALVLPTAVKQQPTDLVQDSFKRFAFIDFED